MEERKETLEEREAIEAWLNGEELTEETTPKNAENSKSNAKVEELRENIAKWQEELDTVWAGKETDAAEVERRNLRNLIANANREIEEIENPKTQNELGNNFDALKEEFDKIKEADNNKKEEINKKELEIKRLKLRIERLKEERENYASQKNTAYKDIYEAYTKGTDRKETVIVTDEKTGEKREEEKTIHSEGIEDLEKELEELEKELEEESKKEEPQAEQDKKIRTVTALRQEYEKQIVDKQKEIRVVKRQIEDIEYATEEAMVEKELEDGTKVKTPKILELYKDLDKLEKELNDLENKKDECQQYLDDIKGKVEARELDPEEIKYFHGQGDIVENTRDDRRANDEYFGFEKVKPGMRKEPGIRKEPRGVDSSEPGPNPNPGTITRTEPGPTPGKKPDSPQKGQETTGKDLITKRVIRIDAKTGKVTYLSPDKEPIVEDINEFFYKGTDKDVKKYIQTFLKDQKAPQLAKQYKKLNRKLNPIILSTILHSNELDEIKEYLLQDYCKALQTGDSSKLPFQYEVVMKDPTISQEVFSKLNVLNIKDNKNLGLNLPEMPRTFKQKIVDRFPILEKVLKSNKGLPAGNQSDIEQENKTEKPDDKENQANKKNKFKESLKVNIKNPNQLKKALKNKARSLGYSVKDNFKNKMDKIKENQRIKRAKSQIEANKKGIER